MIPSLADEGRALAKQHSTVRYLQRLAHSRSGVLRMRALSVVRLTTHGTSIQTLDMNGANDTPH
jgi:hypothetical protein